MLSSLLLDCIEYETRLSVNRLRLEGPRGNWHRMKWRGGAGERGHFAPSSTREPVHRLETRASSCWKLGMARTNLPSDHYDVLVLYYTLLSFCYCFLGYWPSLHLCRVSHTTTFSRYLLVLLVAFKYLRTVPSFATASVRFVHLEMVRETRVSCERLLMTMQENQFLGSVIGIEKENWG